MNRLSGKPGVCLCAMTSVMVCALTVAAQDSKWVQAGVTGRLIYVPDAEGDRILDFSDVGFKGRGTTLIPDSVPNAITVAPVAGDDTATIQAAINQVAMLPLVNGFRGAVQLEAGHYDINTQLTLGASGIVLRGVGRGTNDTVLHGRGTSQRPLVRVLGSGSQSLTGSTYSMIDKVVPAGANSFRVNSTTDLAVGQTVRVERPSTQEWINAVGMDNPPDGDPPWQPGALNIRYDRTITRIEGNRVFLDAPLANSFELQYGGGTMRRYTWAGRIENVGIENLRAESDFASNTDEAHAWEFVSIDNAQNVWVRQTLSKYFGDSAVVSNPSAKWVTVDNAINEDPRSIVTGERRYTFDLSGQLELVANSTANSGRHDFVNNSTRPPGPHVFYNSVANNALNDTGPHQRWATGSLFDNITVNGNQINARNRGSFGTTHGWSGANMVIWNSTAAGFIVHNPPTAQNWLIGSTGPIVNDTQFGQQPPSYVDSHGTPVVVGGTTSLYEAQMNDSADIREFHWSAASGNWSEALDWDEKVTPGVYAVNLRDYMLGDIDSYSHDGAGSVDNAFIDPAWQASIAGGSALPITGFDDVAGNRNVAFTVQHQLDAGERVVHGFLALSLKQSGGEVGSDFIRLFDTSAEHRLKFTDLGWDTQINSTTPFVGVIDMGQYLDELQTDSVNVQINDDTAADWAIYTAAVATPLVDSLGPTVFLDAGSVRVDSNIAPIASLTNGGMATSSLTIAAGSDLSVNDEYHQAANGTLEIEIAGTGAGQFGKLSVGDDATLDGTLSIEFIGGYQPGAGDTFEILSAAGLLGTEFATTLLPDLGNGLEWQLFYEPDAVIAQIIDALLPGDYNRDGGVDAADYVAWRDTLGASVPALGDGADGNLNGVIDPDDYIVWQANFGRSAAAGSGAGSRLAVVPEPTAAAIFAGSIAGLLMLAKRRRHSVRRSVL